MVEFIQPGSPIYTHFILFLKAFFGTILYSGTVYHINHIGESL